MYHKKAPVYTRLRSKKISGGFTLIELMLAMVFVAFILIFMSLTLVQMLRTYDKGNSMKQVNQAGRSIVDDISRSVRSQLPNAVDATHIDAGILCVDDAMYVWNPLYVGSTLNTDPTAHTAVIGDPVSGGMMARKVLSNPGAGCPATFSAAQAAPVTEQSTLLSGRARVLRATVTQSPTAPRLVKLTFDIGTYSRDEFTGADHTHYLTPTLQSNGTFSCLAGSDGDYCAFAEFSTVVYLSKEQ